MKSVSPADHPKSQKEWETHVWQRLIGGFAKTTSLQGITKSLDMLITANEKKKMIKRAAAVSLLKRGKSYNEIGELLWLSPNTISAIRKSVREGEKYVSRYTRNKKEENRKSFTKKGARLRFTAWLDVLFTLPAPPPYRNRYSSKKGTVLPHGKLVFPQRRR